MIIGLCGQAGVGKDTVADFLVKNHGFVKVALADPLKRICREVFDFSDEQLWGPSSERNKPDPRYPALGHQFRFKEHARAVSFEGRTNVWVCRCGVMLEADSYPSEELIAQQNACVSLTPRHALQQLGTEFGRNCYDNVWIDYAMRVAADLLKNVTRYSAKNGALLGGTNISERVPKGVVISDVRFLNEVEAIRKAGGFVWKIERPIPGLEGAAGQHASEQEQNSIPPSLFWLTMNNNNGPLNKLEAMVGQALADARRHFPDQK